MPTENITIVIQQRGAARASRAITGISGSATDAARGVRLLNSALLAVGVTLGAREIIQAADTYTVFRNQVRLVTGSVQEQVAVQRELFNVAQETRAPLDATGTLFRRLALNADQLGASQQDLIDFTRSFNKAIAVSGATAQEARAGMIQFAQGMASGELRGEELRSVLEQLPRVGKAIAEGLNLTLGEFRKMAFAGQLTADQIFDAFASQSEKIAAEFEKIQIPISQAFVVLENAAIRAIGILDQTLGASLGLTAGMGGLAETLDVRLLNAVAAAIEGFAEFIRQGANAIEVAEGFGIQFEDLFNIGQLLVSAFSTFFSSVATGLQAIRVGGLAVAAALDLIGNTLGLIDDAEVAASIENLNRGQIELISSSERTNQALKDLKETAAGIFDDEAQNTASRGLRRFAEDARQAARDIRAAAAAETPDVDLTKRGPRGKFTSRESDRGAQAALNQLIRIENKLEQARLKRIDPLLAEIKAIEDQIEKVDNLKIAEQDRERQASVRAKLEERRLQLKADLRTQEEAEAVLLAQLLPMIQQLATLDKERAQAARDRLAALQAEPGTDVEGLGDLVGEVDEALDEAAIIDLGRDFGDTFGTGAGQALSAAIKGEAFDVGDFFADTIADKLGEAFDRTIDNLIENLSSQLGELDIGGLLGGGGGAGGGTGGFDLGGALGGLAVAGGLVAAGLRSTQSSVSQQARSSVTSTVGATRGVIVGATSIPVSQVGDSIRDGFVPMVSAQNITNERLTQILEAVRAQRAAGVSDEQLLNALLETDAVGSVNLE